MEPANLDFTQAKMKLNPVLFGTVSIKVHGLQHKQLAINKDGGCSLGIAVGGNPI